MTASDTCLDDLLLAVELITQQGDEPTPAAVRGLLPLGISALDARQASIAARLLGYTDGAGLTPAGRRRLGRCPARRALLCLLAAPSAPAELVA
jgi:hypothetical protein